MPYKNNSELPERVKNNLPQHGQDIFREFFNNASKQYDKEQTAFKVAWDAVKEKYKKDKNSDWVKKEE